MVKFFCTSCDTETEHNIVDYNNVWNHEYFSDLEIKVCTTCGLGSAFPEPADSDLEKYYLSEYRAIDSPMFIDFDLINMVDIGLKAQAQTDYIISKINSYTFKKVLAGLDLGAGAGELIRCVSSKLPIEYSVIEKSSDARAFYKKNGIRVYDSLFSLEQKFDLIQSSHVLEHICASQILGYLGALKEKMNEDGYLFIEVPNDDFRRGKFKVTEDCQSSHLTFFSVESLGNLLKKSGFLLLDISTAGHERTKVFADENQQKENKAQGLSKKFKRHFGHVLKVTANQIGLLKLYHKLKYNISNNTDKSSAEFVYGENREAIRVICKKSR